MSSDNHRVFIEGFAVAIAIVAGGIAIYQFFIKPEPSSRESIQTPSQRAVVMVETPTPIFTTVSVTNTPLSITATPLPPKSTSVSGSLPSVVSQQLRVTPRCGEQAYNVEFAGDGTANVQYNFPDGYTDGFISSDPAAVEFSNGKSRSFNTQFVLIVKGFSTIKIKGVGTRTENGAKVVNTYGCVYGPNDATIATVQAKQDYTQKMQHNNIAELYQVSLDGFNLLESNAQK